MDIFGGYVYRHGLPHSLYVDRDSIYRSDRQATVKEELRGQSALSTQFGRAMKQLNVELILANIPQAKGRVERMNGTLQDRLVKEMRLAGREVMIREKLGGTIELLSQRHKLHWKELKQRPSKEQWSARPSIQNNWNWKPSPAHPWNQKRPCGPVPRVSLAPAAPARDLPAGAPSKVTVLLQQDTYLSTCSVPSVLSLSLCRWRKLPCRMKT